VDRVYKTIVSEKGQDMHDRTRQDLQDGMPFFALTQTILQCCFEVMNTLGSGFLESVEAIAKLQTLEKSKILSHFARAATRPEPAAEIILRRVGEAAGWQNSSKGRFFDGL